MRIDPEILDEASKNPSFAMRYLLKFLSSQGIHYSNLAADNEAQGHWNTSSIKQLSYREGQIRSSEKTSLLVRVVRRKLDQLSLAGSLRQDIDQIATSMSALETVMPSSGLQNLDTLSNHIGQRFRNIRKASAFFQFPEKMAFVRWDWEQKRLIRLLVTSQRGENGNVFTMKITGRSQNRRIIIGDILCTNRNTDFSGLAYEVTPDITGDDFLNMDPFDLEEIKRTTEPNEIGFEGFTISNQQLAENVMPVPFKGLDGRGNPISGLGVLIKPKKFEKYGISDSVLSSMECRDDNPELAALLDKFLSNTKGATSHEQVAERAPALS